MGRKYKATEFQTPSLDFAMWLAGFFDGEGCIYWDKKLMHPRITLSQSGGVGLKALQETQRSLGIGTIYCQPHQLKRRKKAWCLRINRLAETKWFLNLISPFLRIKRDRANKTLKILNTMSPLYLKSFWTQAEIKILSKCYPTHTLPELRQLLPKRTYNAIGQKLNELHISTLGRGKYNHHKSKSD